MSSTALHDDDTLAAKRPPVDDSAAASDLVLPVSEAEFAKHSQTICTSTDDAEILSSARLVRKLVSLDTGAEPYLKMLAKDSALVKQLSALAGGSSTPDVQLEAAWALTNLASGTEAQCTAAVEGGAIEALVRGLAAHPSAQLAGQCIWGLGNIAGGTQAQQQQCLTAGAAGCIMRCLPYVNDDPQPLEDKYARTAVWALANLVRRKARDRHSEGRAILRCLARALMDACGQGGDALWARWGARGDAETAIDATWGISHLTESEHDPLDALLSMSADGGACPRVVRQLVSNLKSNTPSLRVASLRVVGNLVTGTEEHVKAVVQAGFLDRIVGLMQDSKRTLRKEACWALSNITADSDAHKQQVIAVPQCAATLLKRAQDGRDVAKEATWAAANLFSGTIPSVISAAIAAGFFGVMLACNVKVPEGDSYLPQVCTEALRSIAYACDNHNVREELWAQLKACPAYPALLHAGDEERLDALTDCLEGHYQEEYTALMQKPLSLEDALAALAAHLEGTAPPALFGAGSGAQARSKTQSSSKNGKGGGSPSTSTAPASAAVASVPNNAPNNTESTPNNSRAFDF